MVGIVGGPPRSEYEQLIDGSAFLHIEDQGTGETALFKMSKLINSLLHNDAEYNKYFEWRNQNSSEIRYKYASREQYGEQGFCKACHMQFALFELRMCFFGVL